MHEAKFTFRTENRLAVVASNRRRSRRCRLPETRGPKFILNNCSQSMIFQDQLQESPQEVEKTVQALSTTLHPRFTFLSPSLSLSLSLLASFSNTLSLHLHFSLSLLKPKITRYFSESFSVALTLFLFLPYIAHLHTL